MPPPVNSHNPLVQADDELGVLLTDPLFVGRTVTSDAFIDWNLELAINWRIHLPREEGARIFLQLHPYYIMELRDTHTTLLSTNLSVPPGLVDLWRSFEDSDWHRDNQHEPKNGGQSVLRQMLIQRPDSTDTQMRWICAVPNHSQPNGICGQTFRRWDRGITHIRAKHLHHKPFPCGGACGVPTCEKRFTSQENLHQHCNPQIERCECGKYELRQNMARHRRVCPTRVPS